VSCGRFREQIVVDLRKGKREIAADLGLEAAYQQGSDRVRAISSDIKRDTNQESRANAGRKYLIHCSVTVVTSDMFRLPVTNEVTPPGVGKYCSSECVTAYRCKWYWW
jgi:hypothetical protein